MPRLGVIGSLVWDEIHGRDPMAPAVEEWGGIAYALAGLEFALPEGWTAVPLIKVGRDLAAEAEAFLRTLPRTAGVNRFTVVPAANNRVVLRYETTERRCERMAGGVPPWSWDELGPMLWDLDAVYVNFISGFELGLGTARALRSGFGGPIYADLHSLLLGMGQDGLRRLQALPDATSWFGCFDLIQVNEDEMRELSDDPLALATGMLGAGVSALLVTLGSRGAAYVARPGFDVLADRGRAGRTDRLTVRTALVPSPPVEAIDPTGCGDVFGATVFATLLGGAPLETAIARGAVAAARNAAYRGASGLAAHLQGSLVAP